MEIYVVEDVRMCILLFHLFNNMAQRDAFTGFLSEIPMTFIQELGVWVMSLSVQYIMLLYKHGEPYKTIFSTKDFTVNLLSTEVEKNTALKLCRANFLICRKHLYGVGFV